MDGWIDRWMEVRKRREGKGRRKSGGRERKEGEKKIRVQLPDP